MNVVNGLESSRYGFVITIAISVVVTAISLWYLKRKRLL